MLMCGERMYPWGCVLMLVLLQVGGIHTYSRLCGKGRFLLGSSVGM